jgi:hypothetical protein
MFRQMFRQKCSWCNWTHDGNSKYTYTHPNYPGKVFYSKKCANSFLDHYGEEPDESYEKPTHESPRGSFLSRLFNLNVRNIRINDKYDWKGKKIK